MKVEHRVMFGNRAIYQDGWVARTIHRAAWEFQPRTTLDKDVWQLFNVNEDFSEANDLAATNPKKLQELQKVFLKEAVKYNVLPIDDRSLERLNPEIAGRPDLMGTRTSLTLYDGMNVNEGAALNTKNHSYTVTADVDLADASSNGVIISQGGRFGGWSLYMKDGIAHHQYNYLGLERSNVAATKALTAGHHVIKYEFSIDEAKAGAGGMAVLSVDGEKVAEGKIPKTHPYLQSMDEGINVGADHETPVSEDYKEGDNKFTGKIQKVTIENLPAKK